MSSSQIREFEEEEEEDRGWDGEEEDDLVAREDMYLKCKYRPLFPVSFEAAQPIADVAHVERHRGFFFPPNDPLLGSRFVPLVSRLSILLRNARMPSPPSSSRGGGGGGPKKETESKSRTLAAPFANILPMLHVNNA